jgi:transcription elongation factor S-II
MEYDEFTHTNRYVYVDWDMSSRCNYSCYYCTPESHDNKINFPKLSDATALVDKITTEYADVKDFAIYNLLGGEPTIWTELPEFSKHVKEANNKKIVKKWENKAFAQIYVDKLRTIYMNLKNPELLQNIRNGEITPQSIAFMTHQELNPQRWKILIEQKIKRDASKFTTNIQASTDMFTCKKCKSKKCTYYELQTRSADEPATIFVTCLDCGKHWKS